MIVRSLPALLVGLALSLLLAAPSTSFANDVSPTHDVVLPLPAGNHFDLGAEAADRTVMLVATLVVAPVTEPIAGKSNFDTAISIGGHATAAVWSIYDDGRRHSPLAMKMWKVPLLGPTRIDTTPTSTPEVVATPLV